VLVAVGESLLICLQLKWRLIDDPILPAEADEWKDEERRKTTKCTVFLSMTSNQISCGQREIIHYLVKHRLVSCIATTCGAIEEDIMKTLRPHYVGDFEINGKGLRMRGINRIGNLLVPNLNYVALEEWFMPVLNRMHDEQVGKGKLPDGSKAPKTIWCPSKMIQRIGEEMTDESSVWYWAARNKIPVFCPGITDGAIGDMLYYHSYERDGFIVDIARDIRRLNNIARRAKKSGMIIIGGGLPKHHICNANLMRNGADYVVYLNTGMCQPSPAVHTLVLRVPQRFFIMQRRTTMVAIQVRVLTKPFLGAKFDWQPHL
jgi:deoxyhypusine synthase